MILPAKAPSAPTDFPEHTKHKGDPKVAFVSCVTLPTQAYSLLLADVQHQVVVNQLVTMFRGDTLLQLFDFNALEF